MGIRFNKKNVVTSVLVVLLVLSVGYIAVDWWQEKRASEEVAIYQAGLNDGYSGAVVEIIRIAESCDVVPIYEGNKTVNLINVECLVES